MKKIFLLMLMAASYAQAMDTSKLMIAAWIETDATRLEANDEIIVTKNVNDTYSVRHFSRPKGLKEKQCKEKAVLEMPSVHEGIVYSLGIKRVLNDLGDHELHFVTPPPQPWYKHTYATHSFAVLATMLVMKALTL